ncbi:MAG: nicotinate phosphoribosyltransferase, partial [Candidatus Aerophobetes bacterium]|nr:nicotinate phosphoribosyltransferase [Candidatus Aerophobetes bacterium]
SNYDWAVLAGVDEVAYLLEGLNIRVWSMPEGTVFHPLEPVMVIEGSYSEFARYETSLLGLLCQASGIATRSARCKKAASGKSIYHFGARRMHPGIASMIDRASFIGGCDGVAASKSAEELGEEPVGTIPHALILLTGDTLKATQLFDEVIEPRVKRVALIDTLGDEKVVAIKVAESLGKNLSAIRLDTPRSRRGNFLEILKEIRWELDLRGFKEVKFFVSGGMDEEEIHFLSPLADAFGVGTWISNSPVIDFSLDIVEVEKKPFAKKGKYSGKKQVWRCPSCFSTQVLPAKERPKECSCGGKFSSLSKPLIKEGKVTIELPSPQNIRKYVLDQLKKVS